jgi:hypothetical protein
VPDVFAGLSEEALRAGATLQAARGSKVQAERAVRHGLGAGAGFSFFFPRTIAGRPTVPANTDTVEFQFRPPKGATLKAKFKLEEMQAGGKPDY